MVEFVLGNLGATPSDLITVESLDKEVSKLFWIVALGLNSMYRLLQASLLPIPRPPGDWMPGGGGGEQINIPATTAPPPP
jgi:hypothetical protein